MKKKILYLMILIISMVLCVSALSSRIAVEKSGKSAEIIVDYDEMYKLAEQSDETLEWWFEELSKLGVSSVAIMEESLSSLVKYHQPVEYVLVNQLIKDVHWKNDYSDDVVAYIESDQVDIYDIVVQTDSLELYEFIHEGLSQRYPESFYTVFEEGGIYTIVLDGTLEDSLFEEGSVIVGLDGKAVSRPSSLTNSLIEDIGLGFDSKKIQQAQEAGLKVVPRPRNYERYADQLVEPFIDEIEEFGLDPSMIVFTGKQVLGYTDGLLDMYEYMLENNIAYGLIETSVQRGYEDQAGITELVEASGYNAVRVFPVVDYIQQRYKFYNYEGSEEIENTLYRAITERNIRAVYFRPFKTDVHTYVTDFDEYDRMFTTLSERLAEHDIVLGEASVFEHNEIAMVETFFMGLGLIVLSLILLQFIFPIKDIIEYVLLGLATLGLGGALFIAPNLTATLLAFAASVIFPSVCIVVFIVFIKHVLLDDKVLKLGKTIQYSIVALIVTIGIALTGGLFIGALLSNSSYMLEMSFFRGVKAAQILPLMVMTIVYLVKLGYRRTTDEIRKNNNFIEDIWKILNENIKILYAVLGGIGLAIGYVYIARTGHESAITASDFEMIVRNFLEVELLARPRTKEFTIAFPALMMSVYFAARGFKAYLYPLLIGATIGFTSVVNTFCHLRAPIYLSVSRTMYSLVFGMVFGVIAILGVHFVLWIYNSYRGRSQHE